MISWGRRLVSAGALGLALILATVSLAESGGADARSGVVIFWNAAQCTGGYRPDVYSAHCEPGPAAAILDFKTKTQFTCVDNEAVDIRWTISAHAKLGPPIPPSEIHWRPECWKAPIDFDVNPDATILAPQYSQTPPANNYMTMNTVVLYDSAKPAMKICIVPLFPKFAVRAACTEAEIKP